MENESCCSAAPSPPSGLSFLAGDLLCPEAQEQVVPQISGVVWLPQGTRCTASGCAVSTGVLKAWRGSGGIRM